MANGGADDQALHWKSKHRALVREFDAQEASWQALEKVLRRLVTRLCIAATGHDPQLDAELTQLTAAVRRDALAPELGRLLESLSKTIVALPESGTTVLTAIQVSPKLESASPLAANAAGDTAVTAREPQLDSIAAAVGALLARLNPRDTPNASAQVLLQELPQAASELGLASIIDRAADIVRERGEQLTRERLSAAALLTEVTSRLTDVAQFIAADNSGFAASFAAGETLNQRVMVDVKQLSDDAQSATDLAPLRRLIATRVESISLQVQEFRDRENSRFKAHAGRTQKLTQQVRELTNKTQVLETDLEAERQRARIDALTGVANRAAFDERLREEIARSARSATPVCVLYWDIDHFKSINDQFGHATGDRVLREVANCLVSRIRTSDFIARMGGEEFVTLLINTSISGALKVADDLRVAVAGLRMHFRGTPVTVTVSCGVTEISGNDSAEAAIERADKALYKAKDAGRNACIAA